MKRVLFLVQSYHFKCLFKWHPETQSFLSIGARLASKTVPVQNVQIENACLRKTNSELPSMPSRLGQQIQHRHARHNQRHTQHAHRVNFLTMKKVSGDGDQDNAQA